jgi:integrase
VLYVRRLETAPNPRTGKPLNASTIEVKLAAARTLYKALRWAKATEANPFENVSPAPDPTPDWEKRKPYSVDDVEKLLEQADPILAVIVLMGAHGGLRISEMCSLKWSDINWARGSFTVIGKGSKKASVTMSGRLEQALKTLREQPSALSEAPTTFFLGTPNVPANALELSVNKQVLSMMKKPFTVYVTVQARGTMLKRKTWAASPRT